MGLMTDAAAEYQDEIAKLREKLHDAQRRLGYLAQHVVVPADRRVFSLVLTGLHAGDYVLHKGEPLRFVEQQAFTIACLDLPGNLVHLDVDQVWATRTLAFPRRLFDRITGQADPITKE